MGELQRWAEHGRAEENANPARRRLLPKPTQGLGVQHLTFNLHAGVNVPGGLPAARKRLLRYCPRPPLALERLSVLEDGMIQMKDLVADILPPPAYVIESYLTASS